VTAYDDASVTNGTTYYYRLTAVNNVGESAPSSEASATPAPVSFPAAPVLDSFARSTGALGPGWQSPALADPGTVSIEQSGATMSSAGAASATWNGGPFAADQEVYLTVPTLPQSSGFAQVAARVSTQSPTNISCYLLRVTPSTGTWDLRKKLNGATSTSMKSVTAPFAAGDALGLEISGSTITAYRKPSGGAWTAIVSSADTAIPAGGYIAFALGDTTIRGGAFGGGSIPQVPAPPSSPPPAAFPTPPDSFAPSPLVGAGGQSPALAGRHSTRLHRHARRHHRRPRRRVRLRHHHRSPVGRRAPVPRRSPGLASLQP
jgi:hypothetical protein